MRTTVIAIAAVATIALGVLFSLTVRSYAEGQAVVEALDAGVPGSSVPIEAATNPAARPLATPTDEGVIVDALGDVLRGDGIGRGVAVIALIGLVWLMRRFGRSPLPVLGWKLLPAWFSTDRGGVVLTFALAFLGAVGHALSAGSAVSLALLWSALLVALTAIGGYAGARRLLDPPDRRETPPSGDFTRPT